MTSNNPAHSLLRLFGISCLSALLFACGGANSPLPIEETAKCETLDEDANSDDCGKLLLGLTDADGDFVTYSVDVTSIQMKRRDGTEVQLLPTRQTVDFAQYVDLTELVTAATVPAGVYTEGSITLDYSNADIQVEKNGQAVEAQMIDADGNPVTSMTLDVQLDNRNQLVIARGIPAMLELDFNLTASHTVDLEADPVTVTTEPFISAEVEPVMEKEFRIRGPLIRVNLDNDFYRIAVRPFYRNDQRYGGINIHTNDETSFEIDGVAYTGSEGLAVMAELPQATASVAFGSYSREAKQFTAISVYAGSSVPGHDKDAAKGVVIARDGNELTLKGATFIHQSGQVTFRDLAIVSVADTTQVFKARRHDDSVSIDDLSVGQAVTILGTIETDANSTDVTMIDATEGAIRMNLTVIAGHVNNAEAGSLDLNLQAIQGRPTDLFNFAGTGIDASFDADPANYEVDLGALSGNGLANDDPVRVAGFVNSFGMSPADFNAWTVVNYANAHSHMAFTWLEDGSANAFTDISPTSLTINLLGDDLGRVHHVSQGGLKTDLTSIDSAPVIAPKFERGIYGIKGNGSIQLFTQFADFSAEVESRLNDGAIIKMIHAQGGYDRGENTISAYKVSIIVN